MTTMGSAGESARAAGVTVRTLHHYDEIDLLVPSERTATGCAPSGRARTGRRLTAVLAYLEKAKAAQ